MQGKVKIIGVGKMQGKVKISIRISKPLLDSIDNLIREGSFEHRTEFFNRAIDYFGSYLETLRSLEHRIGKVDNFDVSESKVHRRLKDLAFAILSSMGCVKLDHEVRILIYGKPFIIDALGVTQDGKKIAVECWVSRSDKREKLKNLQSYFDEVIILTPLDLVQWYEEAIISYQQTLENMSRRFNVPRVNISYNKPSVDILENEELVGREILPYREIKEELMKGNDVLLKDMKSETIQALHAKLRNDFKAPQKKRMFTSQLLIESGQAVWLLKKIS